MSIKKELQFLYDLQNIKIWTIILDSNKIIVLFGKKSKKLQEKIIMFDSINLAKIEFNKRIKEKLKKGYQEVSNINELKIELINENYINYLLKISEQYCNYRNIIYTKYENKGGNNYENLFYKNIKEYHTKSIKNIEKYKELLQNEKIKSFSKSGVIVKTIPKNIKNSLLNSIINFANKSVIDYHPGSDNKVRDVVHPSLYPLLKNIKKSDKITDYWDRHYEESKYQWLPSEFSIDKDGKCKIESYINNLPVNENEIYNNIERLFECVLPEFENIWSYINCIKLYTSNRDNLEIIKYKQLSLKNMRLQVITKIVEINLNNKGNLEGAWHVEGMSHENIVGTASCTLQQDKDFSTELMFKRKYTVYEADELLFGVCQNPPSEISKVLNEGLVPLGKCNIKNGSLILFPNSHIHKVDMKSKCESIQKRTIIVFWLINPDVRITSTKDIKQQNYDIERAYKTRLELMKERTLYKNSFNIRDLNLCEH